jgi:hypothetical protein
VTCLWRVPQRVRLYPDDFCDGGEIAVKTMEEIRRQGLKALARELGPVGMVRSLQLFENGSGDYVKERHQRQDRELAEARRNLRAGNKGKVGVWVSRAGRRAGQNA